MRQRLEAALEPLNVDVTTAKLRILHDAKVKVSRGRDTIDRQLEQRALHASDGCVPRGRPHDQLREHRIVVSSNLAAYANAAVPTHAGATRNSQIADVARRRQKAVCRILARYSTLDGPAVRYDVLLSKGLALPGRNAHLPLHEVDPGDQLGDRMLHLKPCVRFEEVELPIAVQEDLAGPRVHISGGAYCRHRRLTHPPSQLR